jgi:hypothetical protein
VKREKVAGFREIVRHGAIGVNLGGERPLGVVSVSRRNISPIRRFAHTPTRRHAEVVKTEVGIVPPFYGSVKLWFHVSQ